VSLCIGESYCFALISQANVLVAQDSKVRVCDLNLSTTEALYVTLQRSKTINMVTPFYRAPEVVMRDASYSKPIDIWSLGCIFGELLQAMRLPTHKRDRDPLFRGQNIAAMQLQAMFNLIGTPSAAAVQRIADPGFRHMVHTARTTAPLPSALAVRFAHAGVDAVDLLTRMLAFDPADRPTAREVLTHPFFTSMHPSRRVAPVDLATVVPCDLVPVESLDLAEAPLRAALNGLIRNFQPTYALQKTMGACL
jgi:mitogen-activated protein kinase 7